MLAEPNSNIDDLITNMNILWEELLRVYAIKEKLPLADMLTPHYVISADKENQEIEIRNWHNHWKGKFTSENFTAFQEILLNISNLKEKFNSLLSSLYTEGFKVISIDNFTPNDLLLFNEATIPLFAKLEKIKTEKLAVINVKKYEEAARLRDMEKRILELVAQQFEKDFDGKYFINSWYREREVIFRPSGYYEMKSLLNKSGI